MPTVGTPLPGKNFTAVRQGRGAAQAASSLQEGAGRVLGLHCWDSSCVQGSKRMGRMKYNMQVTRRSGSAESASFHGAHSAFVLLIQRAPISPWRNAVFCPYLPHPQLLFSERRKLSVYAPICILRESLTVFNVLILAALRQGLL